MAGLITLPDISSTLALQSTTSEAGNSSVGTSAAITQLVAASAKAIRRISISGVVIPDAAGGSNVDILILTGPGGSETTRGACRVTVANASVAGFSFFVTCQVNLAAGTRVAWKFTVSSQTCTLYTGYTIEEA